MASCRGLRCAEGGGLLARSSAADTCALAVPRALLLYCYPARERGGTAVHDERDTWGRSIAVEARGSLVGMSAAFGMGGLLALSVIGNLALMACVLVATLAVARFAHRLGPWTATKIEGRGFLPSLTGVGVLGLACLLCTAAAQRCWG